MKYNVELNLSVGTSHSLILSKITKSARVLEFGPASGYMTKYMKSTLDCEVYCVEIDEEAAKYATKYAKDIVIGDIEALEWYEKYKNIKFDFVLFADVLEHLRNPQEILKLVVPMLTDKGKIITSIPNIAHNSIIMELMQGKFDYRQTGLLDNTHIKFFTKKSILTMLENAGLSPVEWLVTQLKPETTEFKQDYRYFPEGLSNYLKTLPDGEVYQFVTVSSKSGNEQKSKYEHEYDNYLDSDFIQVFWGENKQFFEQNSLKAVHINNNELNKYTLNLPPRAVGHIRIDIANKFTWGELHYIVVKEINTNTIAYKWDSRLTSLTCSGLNCVQKSDYIEYSVTSIDPQLILPYEIDNVGEQDYTVEIGIKMNQDWFCYQKRLTDDLVSKDQNNLLLEQEIGRYKEELNNCKNELERINTILNSFNELKELSIRNIEISEQETSRINDTILKENSNLVEQLNIEIQTAKSEILDKSSQINQDVLKINYEVSQLKQNIFKRIYRKLFGK